MKTTQPLALLLLFFLLINSISYSDIINVPGDQPTIQLGLLNANNGDIVLVQPGTYVENIIWPSGANGVMLLSAGDTTNTIIDGNNSGPVIGLYNGEDSTTIISGFQIINGSDGGIVCNASSPLLQNLLIKNNQSNDHGGGIFCLNDAETIIRDCFILYNFGYEWGGGISVQFCTPDGPSIENCTIKHNVAGAGAGVFVVNAKCTILNSNISYNGDTLWTYNGGGINITGASANVVIKKTLISYNLTVDDPPVFVGDGGGIYCEGPIHLDMEDVIIYRNTTGGRGGGAFFYSDCNVNIRNSYICENQAREGAGVRITGFYSDVLINKPIIALAHKK